MTTQLEINMLETNTLVHNEAPENTLHHSYAKSIERAVKCSLSLVGPEKSQHWDAYIVKSPCGYEVRRSTYIPLVAAIVRKKE